MGYGKGCQTPTLSIPQLHPVTKMLQAAPGSQPGSRSSRKIMSNTPPSPSIPHHWQANDTWASSQNLLCVNSCNRQFLYTTAQELALSLTPFYRGENQGFRRVTCPTSPKTKISVDVEPDPANQTPLYYTTRSPRNPPRALSLHIFQMVPHQLSALVQCPLPEVFSAQGRVSQHSHPQVPLGTLVSIGLQGAPSMGIKKH